MEGDYWREWAHSRAEIEVWAPFCEGNKTMHVVNFPSVQRGRYSSLMYTAKHFSGGRSKDDLQGNRIRENQNEKSLFFNR